ncbi:MAG TPA: hypothetical protein VFJ57_06135 [Solirubrobacterales bacterium]|nr:hypothetical protein [Solirubrobacterales bacterium]
MNLELSRRAEIAYNYAQEACKQVITLSTAVFALTLTFAEKFAQPGACTTLLEIGWAFYLASILFGIGVLMNLTGNVAEPPVEEDAEGQDCAADSIFAWGIRAVAILQFGSFFLALLLTLLYGTTAT